MKEAADRELNLKNGEIDGLKVQLESANLKIESNLKLERENNQLKNDLQMKNEEEKILGTKLIDLEEKYLDFIQKKIEKKNVLKKQYKQVNKLIQNLDLDSFDKEMINFKNFIS